LNSDLKKIAEHFVALADKRRKTWEDHYDGMFDTDKEALARGYLALLAENRKLWRVAGEARAVVDAWREGETNGKADLILALEALAQPPKPETAEPSGFTKMRCPDCGSEFAVGLGVLRSKLAKAEGKPTEGT
jgi:hypothetical protein